MSTPVFDLSNYVTGDPTSAPITKANFQAIVDWANTTRLDNSNLNSPRHNVAMTCNAFGQLNAGTYYYLFAVPQNQLAWVPIEVQIAAGTLNGNTFSVIWQVYNGGVWTDIQPLSVTAVSNMTVQISTAFSNPWAGGLAAGANIRAKIVVAGGHIDDASSILILKAYNLS